MELYILQCLRRELEIKQRLNQSKINTAVQQPRHQLQSCPEPPISPYRNTVKSRVSLIPSYQPTTTAPKPLDATSFDPRTNLKLTRSMSESSASPSRQNKPDAMVAKMMLQNIEQFKLSYVK